MTMKTKPPAHCAMIEERLSVLGLTVEDLSSKLGVTTTAVRHWMTGRNACKRIDNLSTILFPQPKSPERDRRAFVDAHNAWFHRQRVCIDKPPNYEESDPSFRLGLIKASMIVMDACLTGYSHAGFESSTVSWLEPEIPEAWKSRMAAAEAEAEALCKTGKINDNPIVALRRIRPTRVGSGEPSGFVMEFSEMTYAKKRAATIFFNKYLTEEERAELLSDPWQLDPILTRCLNTQVAIITSDGRFLLSQRSPDIINGNKVTCGIAETMEESDAVTSDGLMHPEVFRAAQRGLLQEAGINLDQVVTDSPRKIVKFISLCVDMEHYEHQFIGIADFREASSPELRAATTARRIEQNLRTGRAKDKWEHRAISFVDFQLRPMMKKLREETFTNYGVVCLVQALQFDGFSDEAIAAAYENTSSDRD